MVYLAIHPHEVHMRTHAPPFTEPDMCFVYAWTASVLSVFEAILSHADAAKSAIATVLSVFEAILSYADAAKYAIATVLSVFEAILSYADAAKYAIATVPQCG